MSLTDQQWYPTSVQVTVLQARGLRVKGKSGTNDAYAVMQVGKEKYQTSVVEKSVAPVWKEEAAFDLPSLLQGGGGGGGGGGTERTTLRVHVLHRALVGPDKLLGQAVINLLQLSEDKTRNKTEWFKLLDKTGKADKDRGEVLVDIQFMRNNMTASMFDLSAAGKSRSRLGKFKDKVRGKKKESDSASTIVPSFTQVLTDSEEEGNGDAEITAGKDEKKKKHKMKSLFSPKSNLQRNMSQSMSVLPAKNSSLSGSQSSGLNVDSSEGKKKFKFMIHKRSGSSGSKDSSSGHQKHVAAEQSNLCINGSHIYCEEPQPRTSRIGSNFSLASSGHGSMEDVPDNSPPSVDSLRAVRQYSPWTEEEEEEAAEVGNRKEDVDELKRQEEERSRMEAERMREEEEEERVRRQQEEAERLAEEKMKQKRQRIEEEEKRQREEEEERAQEERRRQEEECKKRRLEEERRRIEEEKVRKEEEEKKKREEEERAEEAERVRREEERERLAEEKRILEERRRIEEEEKRQREEEEEKIRMEEEERRRQEEERKLAEEKRRLEEERRRIEEEKVRREEEERVRREEELAQEERRRQEEERKLAEEKEKMRLEEERRRIEEEKVRKEEEERVRREEELAHEERRRREEEEMVKKQKELEELERRKREEEERIKKEEKARMEKEEYDRLVEEKRKLEEEERKRIEAEEKLRREEEERERVEEERRRKEEEEREKLAEEKRMLEEQEKRRIEEEEQKQREEEEIIRKEEERRQEERARKEREEHERLVEEKMRQVEQERRRIEEEERIRKEEQERVRIEEERRKQEKEEKRMIEEEEKIKRDEEERIRREEEADKERKEEEARKLEKEKLTGITEEQKKRENKTKNKAPGMKSEVESPVEVTSTNPFDENFSNNPFEENPNSAGPNSSTAKVSTVQQRSQSTVSLLGGKTAPTDDKDLISTQREKRQAPQPPGRNQAEKPSQGEQDRSAQHLAQINKQSKDKGIKTVSVLPQRSVQMIAPLNRSPTDAKNTQSLMQSSATKDATNVTKNSKRPAPSIPCTIEERPSSKSKTALSSNGKFSHECGSEAKQKPTVYGLNPFEDDEDESELTAQDDTRSNTGSVQWPPAVSQAADKDAASQAKIKSSKTARAPPLPAKMDATSSTLINQDTEGSHVTDDTGVTGPDNGVTHPCESEHGQTTPLQESQSAMVQSTGEEAGGKKAVPPTPSRRLQPVKPLNPLGQQSVSLVQEELDHESIQNNSEVQEKTKVNDTGLKGPYSQLTREELISLVLKQEKQLSERDKKISELEQYIDNLLVRVMEEKPSILMSLNSQKKCV